MGTHSRDYYLQLVNHATQWARTGKVDTSLNLRTYLNRVVPKERGIDRGFWLGEVLGAIRRSAASDAAKYPTSFTSSQLHDLDRMIDLATARAPATTAKKSHAQLNREIDESLAAKKAAPKPRTVGYGLSKIDDDEWSWSVEYLTEGPINYAAPTRREVIADGVEYSRGEAADKIKEMLAKLGVPLKEAVALPF